MMNIKNKTQKEVNLYKDLPTPELKKVIKQYKSLSKSNSDFVNFIFSLLCFGIPYFIIFKFTTWSIFSFILIHYLFFWEFLHKYKKFKLVGDEDKEEIDEIILLLEEHLKNKTPIE